MEKPNFQRETEKAIERLCVVSRPPLLLHACCAPCSSYVLEYLTQYFSITLFFCNPNITDPAEYQKRLAELLTRIRETEEPEEQLETPGSFSAEELLKRLAYTDEYVETALRRIVAASDTKLSIEELADEMMISASYLSRRFKQSTGQTFLDTLNTQRVKRAAALLKNGGRTSEVAEKTGFSDYKHFCAVFKRYTGMTPRDFGKRK